MNAYAKREKKLSNDQSHKNSFEQALQTNQIERTRLVSIKKIHFPFT